MTPEHAKKMLPIIEAYAKGEVIQYKSSNGIWYIEKDLTFTDEPENYRIKPKPMEFWINIYPDGGKSEPHMSKEKADEWATTDRIKCIRVREVEE